MLADSERVFWVRFRVARPSLPPVILALPLEFRAPQKTRQQTQNCFNALDQLLQCAAAKLLRNEVWLLQRRRPVAKLVCGGLLAAQLSCSNFSAPKYLCGNWHAAKFMCSSFHKIYEKQLSCCKNNVQQPACWTKNLFRMLSILQSASQVHLYQKELCSGQFTANCLKLVCPVQFSFTVVRFLSALF